MKKGLHPHGFEAISFGTENSLKIFEPNTFNFRPKKHIILDEVQECILDNFWNQYNNKREDKGYMLSILNSLAEYFNLLNKGKMMNNGQTSAQNMEYPEHKTLYVLFEGKKPGIYTSYEEISIEKLIAKKNGDSINWKSYACVEEAQKYAKAVIGPKYYIQPSAKEYIQKVSCINNANPATRALRNLKIEESSSKYEKEDISPKYKTYKECLVKGVDPLDGEYIDMKIDEKWEDTSKVWKEELKMELKGEILKEIRLEINTRFEDIKKECDTKNDFHLSDDDHMDIAGHGQPID